MITPSQLTLAVALDDDARFENYFISRENQQAVASLQESSSQGAEKFVYLWGAPASGKTHLLQAVCHQASAANQTALYLSLKDFTDLDPAILEGSHRLAVVCLDDVESIAGQKEWEQALFTLFNQLKESGTGLLVSAVMSPQELSIALPDLQSRLQSMLVFNLANLTDEEKKQALQHRAGQRGFELTDAVADYILSRAGRGFDELMEVLDVLDANSLVEKRKLTVPLVKSTLNW